MAYSTTGLAAGDEVSSTYEGVHVTLLESELTHISRVSTLVEKGDAVQAGEIVGIALLSALADTDKIVIDTEGIWCLSCKGVNKAGNSAIAVGDRLYIQSDAQVDKNSTDGLPFGYALSTLTSGATGLVIVKVHN